MQFVANGPDIPNALLQAHEDSHVVFFCGAGVSFPAGLPGFKGLVDEIYRRVGTTPSAIEQEAYARGQFDATLDLLERRLPGQRIAVRKALAQVLQPRWRRKGATATHAALLQLARSREGSVRLVTTNFDRVFERAAQRAKQRFNAYAAPMLPIPKSSRWNGLVYLHGLLPDKADDSVLHRLVLTSGDFGLAYLTERWAARFVSELFRNYVVCFVGYSINDPVLRYMMDALAADRMLARSPRRPMHWATASLARNTSRPSNGRPRALPLCSTKCLLAATTTRCCTGLWPPGLAPIVTASSARSASSWTTPWHALPQAHDRMTSWGGCSGRCHTNRGSPQSASRTSTPHHRSNGWKRSRRIATSMAT